MRDELTRALRVRGAAVGRNPKDAMEASRKAVVCLARKRRTTNPYESILIKANSSMSGPRASSC